MKLIEIERGAQQDRFVLGAQEVSLRIAAELGSAIELSSPVRRIVQDDAGVSVVTDRGTRRASYAIVAVPPALAARIDHEPGLPAARDALTQRMPMGATIKCIAGYERPFWRDKGLSGEAVSTGGPVVVVFDDSPPDGTRGALVAFIVGEPARAWGARSPEDRRRAVIDDLVRFFGPEASHTVAYVEQDWQSEVWTRGCPTGSTSPFALSLLGAALREPVGRLHWAGTETATEHAGYMDGAVQSGERAAAEIAARLA